MMPGGRPTGRGTSIWPLFTAMKGYELNAAGDEVDQELELCRDTVDSQRMNVRPDMPEDALEAVIARLDGAMTRVEGAARSMRSRVKRAELAAIEARDADVDRAHLAEALDEARGREAALQEAAQFASDALDGAITELRDLLRGED
ncbi:DUF4164 family protein [Maricaulis maris]|uniref:DUF4164 family protein n=1 Tax=Maricaulis maris TaxID=74318 RepID=UPI00291DF174|nr:hypothetical protein MACH15_24130 [Maricaulis maris]